MPRVVIAAGRRGLAGVVLFLAGVAAVDAALFKVWHSAGGAAKPEVVNSIHHLACTPATCYSTRPGWAIPMAIAVGLVGIVVAALIYRPHPTTR
jgi:hypothetical protein